MQILTYISNSFANMNRFKSILLLIFSLLMIISCGDYDEYTDEDCYDYDYSDCNTIEPEEGHLMISLTINKQNPEVVITVFEGDIENNDIIAYDTIDQPFFQVPVKLDKSYSATAKYKVDDKTIIAIDGDKIKKTSSVICDSTCWDITGGYIDVKLKYDNY